MIQVLKRFVAWLEKRYPPKLMVTQGLYDALAEKVYRSERALQTLSDKISTGTHLQLLIDRIDTIEARQAELAKMLATPKKSESEIARDQFIRGELPRPFTRKQVEAAK